MKQNKLILFILSSFFILTFFSGCGQEEAKTIVEDNTSFADLKKQSNKTYTLKTTEGKTITLKVENQILTSKEFAGKNVLINFWATWCPPCLKEIPMFNKMYEKYNDKFVIVGVLFEKDKDAQELAQFMEKYNMKFPVTVGEENFRMAKAFDDVQRVPESFLYGSDGKFIKKYIGEVDEADLEALLK